MQIFNTKLRIIVLIIAFTLSLSSNAASFDDYFQSKSDINSTIADRVTHYYSEDVKLPIEQQQIELKKLESQLSALESSHTNQAIYWFIRGLNDRNLAAHYNHTNETETVKQHIENKNNAYRKALSIAKNNPQKLSAAIYSTMKHGLPEDLKIEATQFELAQGGNIENESAYWYLHWSNIDQLKKAGRHEEADKAFDDMQKAMRKKNVDMSVYADLSKQVEKQTLKRTDKKIPTPIQQDNTEENKLISKEVIMPALLIIALLSLVLLTIYELFIKTKK